MAEFDEFGAQIPDVTPVETPIQMRRMNRSFSSDDVREIVRLEISRQAQLHGFDTIEEADDFEVDDDSPDFVSAFEMREEFERLPSGLMVEKKPAASPPVVGGGGGEPPASSVVAPVEPVANVKEEA